MSLYAWVDLLSISVPFLISFQPRLKFYKDWVPLFMAIVITMTPYIIWDVYFTQKGYWGFNPDYLSGVYIFDLPIEEWLFFICIPYACVFTHVSILEINKNIGLGSKFTNTITIVLVSVMVVIIIRNSTLAYTVVDMLFAIVALLLVHFFNRKLLRSYYISFLFMSVPFLMVNGVLTGSGIEDQVVWYNNDEILGIRIFTIPVEDTVYAFSLILFNLFLFEKLKNVNFNRIL